MTISPPQVRSEDIESQKASPRSWRCLDYILVSAVVLLTMAVGSMGVFYMAWERPHQEKHHEKVISEGIQRERLRNSAQFKVDSVLVNETIKWTANQLHGSFQGEHLSYDDSTQEILVKNEGFYFIYSQIFLNCVEKNKCSELGDVSFLVKKHSTETILKLKIYNGTLPSFSAKIEYLKANTKLKMQAEVSKEITSWQLDPEHTFMGLFWFGENIPSDESK